MSSLVTTWTDGNWDRCVLDTCVRLIWECVNVCDNFSSTFQVVDALASRHISCFFFHRFFHCVFSSSKVWLIGKVCCAWQQSIECRCQEKIERKRISWKRRKFYSKSPNRRLILFFRFTAPPASFSLLASGNTFGLLFFLLTFRLSILCFQRLLLLLPSQ